MEPKCPKNGIEMPQNRYLSETVMLDFSTPKIQELVETRSWTTQSEYDRVGAAYEFVRNEICFGYNESDTIPASAILSDGYGQCNTKATLLMTLLRTLDISCRLHGFTIDKSLQRGVVPEAFYWLAPQNILHSWVEVHLDGDWVNLEGFILDQPVLDALKAAFPTRNSLCAYGAGTDCLQAPNVDWAGTDTYIQRTGINRDFGLFDAPDDFYRHHRQELTGFRGLLYRRVIRHWMNWRVSRMRHGKVPRIPGGEAALSH